VANGTPTDLGTLCGPQTGATAINDNGQIVATSGGLTLLLIPN
jgi:uncharacterized membrane protein